MLLDVYTVPGWDYLWMTVGVVLKFKWAPRDRYWCGRGAFKNFHFSDVLRLFVWLGEIVRDQHVPCSFHVLMSNIYLFPSPPPLTQERTMALPCGLGQIQAACMLTPWTYPHRRSSQSGVLKLCWGKRSNSCTELQLCPLLCWTEGETLCPSLMRSQETWPKLLICRAATQSWLPLRNSLRWEVKDMVDCWSVQIASENSFIRFL